MTPERRILIKEVNWLGDMVMSLPAIATIREARQAAHLAVLVKRELSGFFDGISWIDEVIPYQIRRGTHGIRDRFELLRRLHKRSFDTAVLLPRSFESALWMALARIPRRIGVAAEGRRWLLTRPLQVDMKAASGACLAGNRQEGIRDDRKHHEDRTGGGAEPSRIHATVACCTPSGEWAFDRTGTRGGLRPGQGVACRIVCNSHRSPGNFPDRERPGRRPIRERQV